MSLTVYDSLSDGQLAVMVQDSDEKAADALIGRYLSLARVKAKKISESVPLYDVDDLTQEAMTGFLSAVYTYRPCHGTSFRTYANVCMNNRLFSVANAMRAKRLVPESVILPLDELNETADEMPEPEDYVISGCMAEKINEIINTGLSDYESAVLSLFLSGKSYGEIAVQTDSDPKAVDNAIQRIRRKLRAVTGK